MRVLIVGAGIAGPTLAYWLRRTGHEPTLVERAPQLRRGGYVVDFWGAGFDVADRMGLVPRLMDEGYRIREVREVTRRGRRITHFDLSAMLDAVGGRYVSIARSDLAAAVFGALDGEVETIFGDTVESIDDDGDRVLVELARGGPREFDLVVGADGLHSRVRALTFGQEREYTRDLGIAVAAFDIDGSPSHSADVVVTHATVGAQVLRFPLRDGTTMFNLTFRHDGEVPVDDVAAQHALVRRELDGMGWEVPRALRQMADAQSFYLDRASQVLLPSWSRGRVALVGDAAACPSLLAGQGSALAMVEAYVLAAELHRAGGDHRAAFAAYERRLAPVVRSKQDAATGLGLAFAPRNRRQLLLRNAMVGLMGIPLVARLSMGRTLSDPIELPPVPTG